MENNSGISQVYEYKCLVLADPVEEKTAGGIILADTTKDRKKFDTTNGTLILTGDLAFTDPDWGDRPRPGDRILMAKNCGYFIDGTDYKVINDKDIIGKLARSK